MPYISLNDNLFVCGIILRQISAQLVISIGFYNSLISPADM